MKNLVNKFNHSLPQHDISFPTRHAELVSASLGCRMKRFAPRLNKTPKLARARFFTLTLKISWLHTALVRLVPRLRYWQVQGDKVAVGLRGAFTLAEVMIVLAVIGILVAILLPTAQNLTPDKAILKFKKGNISLTTAIRDLANSDTYFYDGDLGLDKEGDRIDNPKYFCNALGDILTTKKVECSDNDLGYNTTALANLPNIETDEIDGVKIYEYADCMCKQHTESGAEIILSDNTVIYTVNPNYHFGSLTQDPDATEQKRLFNLCSNEKRYKYICMDIDGIDNGEDPFGYALRADGKIIYGARAQAWIKAEINGDEVPETTTSSTCETTSLSIIAESDSCKPVYSSGTTVIEKTCELSEHCTDCSGLTGECVACENGYELAEGACVEIPFECSGTNFMYIDELNICVTRRNMGDNGNAVLAIPESANVFSVVASSGECAADSIKCCYTGTTSSSCDSVNGGYSGCKRTVCNYSAAEAICSNFNYGGKTWRLPTKTEMNKFGNYSIGLGSSGLMFCDYFSDLNSAQCADALDYCVGSDAGCGPNDVWTQSKYYVGALNNGGWQIVGDSKGGANGVRCVTDL